MIELNAFAAGVLTIGFIFGAYFTETFRGAFQAVPAGQMEAGRAYGMSGWQVFWRILFPQMLRYALPGMGNNWLVLLKSTAIVSMIGLSDMTWLADQAGRSTHQPFTFYLAVCVTSSTCDDQRLECRAATAGTALQRRRPQRSERLGATHGMV
jgi:ABC-type arginine transport system permease subunit